MKKEITKHLAKITDGEPYLITITNYPEKGQDLNTSLFINKFPFAEFVGTQAMIKKLMDDEIKKATKK